MNLISDYEAHKRDEEAFNSAEAERQWRDAQKCPIHDIPLIAGRGYTDATGTHTEVFEVPRCPECMAQAEREATDVRRLNDLERQTGCSEE